MKTAIIIPARFGSSRLPGKPLAQIHGQSMLQRVVNIAKAATKNLKYIDVVVATDDSRISEHCKEIAVPSIMTSLHALTGTDRIAEAVDQLEQKPDFVLNLQGDAPLTPPDFIHKMITSFAEKPCDVITPVTRLTWLELDKLRIQKQKTPFSGTTAVFNEKSGKAYWFSKNIIPGIRKESELRNQSEYSPIYRHIGLYGYSYPILKKFIHLAESSYEHLEGLEQLRILECGFDIRCVEVSYGNRANMSGVDSPEDITRAEELIRQHGELL